MAIAAPLLETTTYLLAGHDERCLVAHGSGPHCVLLVPPLFDEANKMRHFVVQFMDILAKDFAISALLPDLPGTMESQRPLAEIGLNEWQDALSDIISQHGAITHIAALRAGGDIIGHIDNIPKWCLAPMNSWRQLRILARAQLASEREAGQSARALKDIMDDIVQKGGHLAGYDISARLAAALQAGPKPADAHQVQLVTDDKPADSRINGSPLWLRVEPGHDDDMAQAMAENIAQWIAS